jgi:hypothetical protein
MPTYSSACLRSCLSISLSNYQPTPLPIYSYLPSIHKSIYLSIYVPYLFIYVYFTIVSGTEEVKKYAILTKKAEGEDDDSDDDDYDREDREISFVHDVSDIK